MTKISNLSTKIINFANSLILKLLVRSKRQHIRSYYWNLRARDIHGKWGNGVSDFEALKGVISLVKPTSLLDIGCGSGRCFSLYMEMNIPEVVGQDISSNAILICKKRFPNSGYKLLCCDIKDLEYDYDYFDLIISTRALSAVLPKDIEDTIDALCKIGKFIYINEMTDSDCIGPSNYWFKHDYEKLMRMNNYSIVKTGIISVVEDGKHHDQTWKLCRKLYSWQSSQ